MHPIHIGIGILSSFLMSLNFIVMKLGVQHFSPLLFAALRFLSIVPFAFFFPKPKVPFRALVKISLCWGVIYLGGVNLGLSLGMSAGAATIITQLSTPIGFFLSWWMLKDPPSVEKIAGAFIGFLGIALISFSNTGGDQLWGLLICLGAAFSFALGAVYAKQAKASTLTLNIWVNVISILPMFGASLITNEPIITQIQTATWTDWSLVVWSGWCSTFLGGICWLFIVNQYSLTVVIPFRLLIPVFGVALAYYLLGETYHLITWIGGWIVIVGLSFPYALQWEKKSKNRG